MATTECKHETIHPGRIVCPRCNERTLQKCAFFRCQRVLSCEACGWEYNLVDGVVDNWYKFYATRC